MEIARRDGGAALRGASPIPAARGGGGGVFAGRYAGPVYVVSSNGTLHALGQVSAVDLEPPAPFLPPNARFSDLTAIGSMLYTSTSNGCGGVANGVWAITLDPKNKTVSSWKTNGGSPVGNLAFTAGGKIIVAVGPGTTAAGGYANAIVALDAKTLQPLDWFTSPSAAFVTTPVVINQGGREIVAAASRDAIFLLDAGSLGGANHSTPLFVMQTDKFEPDALATFEQPAGTPWLLAPGPARNRRVQNCRSGRQNEPPARMGIAGSCRTDGADCRQRRRLRRFERPSPGSGGVVCVRLAIGSRALEQRTGDDVTCAARKSLGEQQSGARRHV